MKRGYLLTALLFTAFMFPFFGNISNADALGNYGCGNKDRKTHVNCLRGLLTSTPYGLTVPKGKNGLGKYGCGRKAGNKTKRKHVNCLRRLLDQHGPHLAKGGAGPTNAPGMHPPMGQPGMPPMGDMDCVNAGNPTEVAACWNAKAHNGPPPGGMPPTGAQPVLPPTGGMPTAAMPPADPCMAVTDPNDIVSCRASHPVTGMGMPPTMAPGTMPPGTMMPPMGMPPMGMPPTGMHPPMGQPGMPPMGDPCMVVPAGPDRDACYATTPAPGS